MSATEVLLKERAAMCNTLEKFGPDNLPPGDVACEREPARPQLGPVRQELLLVECRLVDQLFGARRAEDLQAQARRELDLLLDERLGQSAANRSTGTPSGSPSCA